MNPRSSNTSSDYHSCPATVTAAGSLARETEIPRTSLP